MKEKTMNFQCETQNHGDDRAKRKKKHHIKSIGTNLEDLLMSLKLPTLNGKSDIDFTFLYI